MYDMENRLKIPEKYRFPCFVTLHWYAAKYFINLIKTSNKDKKPIKPYLLNGCKCLKDTLKKWLSTKDYYVEHGHEIPEHFNCEKIIKVFNKELHKAELLINYYKQNEEKASKTKVAIELKAEINTKRKLNGDDKIENSSNNNMKEEEEEFEAKVPRLIMKLPKINDTATTNSTNENENLKSPIKLKIKIDSQQSSSDTDVNNSKTTSIKEESFKLTYTDSDYIYPSLTDDLDKNENNINEIEIKNIQNNENGNSNKRIKKIKPHAMKYLINDKKKNTNGSSSSSNNNEEIKKQNDIDMGSISSSGSSSSDSEEMTNMSKKSNKKAINKKKQSNNNTSNNTEKKKSTKVKKGYATAKQRLGKILKLNRIIHF